MKNLASVTVGCPEPGPCHPSSLFNLQATLGDEHNATLAGDVPKTKRCSVARPGPDSWASDPGPTKSQPRISVAEPAALQEPFSGLSGASSLHGSTHTQTAGVGSAPCHREPPCGAPSHIKKQNVASTPILSPSFSSLRLVLLISEYHKQEIIRYTFFCTWLL